MADAVVEGQCWHSSCLDQRTCFLSMEQSLITHCSTRLFLESPIRGDALSFDSDLEQSQT